MNVYHMLRWCTVTALVALGATIGWNQHVAAQQSLPSPQQQASAVGQDGVEVLTRGPLHEAFAETITFDPEPGIVVPQAPPADIEELPPEQRPEGANLTWLPGYWAWDDERDDFLWVSGIWRALPPGRQWVPGYFGQSRQGYQWTSGYWADARASEIDYLPEPPATVEAGPNIAAPSADHIWLPGSWIWHQNRYAWRPGYWTVGHQDWVWVPDHYVWTPSGYVFVDGYYDYSVPRRGIVFAPVYFHGGLRTQRGFSYSPSTVINPAVFVSHLFLRPRYGHYYFGDYYGSTYRSAGFSPWFSFHSSRRGYDPIYASHRWQHRHDGDWEQRARASYRNLRDNEDARPPRTWAAQRERAERGDASNRRSIEVAAPLVELAQRRDAPLRFQPVAPAERQQFGQRGQEYRKYLRQRQQLEAATARTPDEAAPTAAAPARRPLPRSPFVAAPVEQLDKKNAPPQRHEVLKPDLQVQPQPRARGGQSGARQALRQRAEAGREQQQDPRARRNAQPQQAQPQQAQPQQAQPQQAQPQQAQPQRKEVNQGNRQGAPAGQSQGQGRSRGQGGNRGQAQGASSDQPQSAPQKQPRGDSKQKEKD